MTSGKLSRDILQEIIHFIEADSMFIGMDSFLTILLPFDVCIDYLLNICPEILLNFAKVTFLAQSFTKKNVLS